MHNSSVAALSGSHLERWDVSAPAGWRVAIWGQSGKCNDQPCSVIPAGRVGEVPGVSGVYERLQGIVAEQLGVEPDQVTRDAEFVQDLNADSLDMVELVMSLEEEFGVEISDEEVENIRTVGDAVAYIEENAA